MRRCLLCPECGVGRVRGSCAGREALIAELEQADAGPARLPSHLELCARVHATSLDALERGDFHLTVTSVSRAAGVVTGRFLHLLTLEGREALTGGLVDLPSEDEALSAQLSFPPLDPATAHVTRAMRVLPALVSLAEHRNTASADVLTASELAVGCDSHRLYLTAPPSVREWRRGGCTRSTSASTPRRWPAS